MLNDFKAFIARGNVLDLAIAVIIGAAFGAIVKTFTDGIIMPFVGLLTGKIDFRERAVNLADMSLVNSAEAIKAAQDAKAPLIMYGQLINDVINFLIVAFVLFLVARYAMRLFEGLKAVTPPTGEEVLLTEIRDILKEQKNG